VANKLTVPPRAVEVLHALGALPETHHVSLRERLSQAQTLATPDSLVMLFAESLGFDREQGQALVAETFSLVHVISEHNHTLESASLDIAEAPELALTVAQQVEMRQTITALLSAGGVLALSAAASVFTAHQRLFTSARVHVDIRPVFDARRERTVGSLVTRKLQLGYFEEGEYRTFEIALQEAGYNELVETLEGGRREASITEDMLATAGMTVFKFDDSEREGE